MNQTKIYFDEMGAQRELKLIDEHKFVELIYADLPPLMPPVKVNPIVRAFSNLTLALGIGMFVAWLVGMIAPTWFALVCGGSCAIVYCIIWFGSMLEGDNT